jgi:hypothetical protein
MSNTPGEAPPDMKLAAYGPSMDLLRRFRAEMMARPAPYGRLLVEMPLLREIEDFLRAMNEPLAVPERKKSTTKAAEGGEGKP